MSVLRALLRSACLHFHCCCNSILVRLVPKVVSQHQWNGNPRPPSYNKCHSLSHGIVRFSFRGSQHTSFGTRTNQDGIAVIPSWFVLVPKDVSQHPWNGNQRPQCYKECHSLSHGGVRFSFLRIVGTTLDTTRMQKNKQKSPIGFENGRFAPTQQ